MNSRQTPVKRGRPGLVIDTSFTSASSQLPKQIFPYETKLPESSFVNIAKAKAARRPKQATLKAKIASRLPGRAQAQRSASGQAPAKPPADIRISPSSIKKTGPLHRRIKGLRPAPLNLVSGVPLSDRAMTIGIGLPQDAVTDHATGADPAYQAHDKLRDCKAVQTPTIVITPAKEDFGLPQSPKDAQRGPRPSSSIYSRYTNCAPRRTELVATLPVPPLPLVADYGATKPSIGVGKDIGRDCGVDSCTVFEEDASPALHQSCDRSHLPTPRRSRGWWNVITSPFFWQSPQALDEDEDEDRQRMLDNASDMPIADEHAGEIFLNRAPGDNGLRSAPADTGSVRPMVFKRSDTAPGALDASSTRLNIYRIPSQGLAAAYYDPTRHFPSLMHDGPPELLPKSLDQDLCRSHSVVYSNESKEMSSALSEKCALGNAIRSRSPSMHSPQPATLNVEGPVTVAGNGDGRHHEPTNTEHVPAAQVAIRIIFSTPGTEELSGASPRPHPPRQVTETTMQSHFSPLSSPLPVVDYARIATFIGPHFARGEPREVDLVQDRTPGPPALPIPESVAASDPNFVPRHVTDALAEVPPRPAVHARNASSDSLGLGITDGDKELFPAPRAYIEQPRLGADRFGQLTNRCAQDDILHVPWYRRFFWTLVSIFAFSLVMLVVMLVLFIPQRHGDMPVQAEWLNLTGFPPLPTGVATIAQPRTANHVSGCVAPRSLWTCAAPDGRGSGDQPSFRLEIRFRNGTVARNETEITKRSVASASTHASSIVRRSFWSSSVFASDPAPPTHDDQMFLGQYTDNTSIPYNGEQTPFYLSLLNPMVLVASSSLVKRGGNPYPHVHAANMIATSNASTTASQSIPRPAVLGSGKPADPILYPYVEAQPLRLYDRGEETEHYGFYTYFDRTVLISINSSNTTGSSNDLGGNTASNVPLTNASAVCTWSQTRMHVQIWTKKGMASALGDIIPLSGLPAANGTANDFSGSGSFPYHVTVTLDRHGGHAKLKGVYCYGLETNGEVNVNAKRWISEDRGFEGVLVNPAAGPTNGDADVYKRGKHGIKYGGVDGGDGGCACQWRS